MPEPTLEEVLAAEHATRERLIAPQLGRVEQPHRGAARAELERQVSSTWKPEQVAAALDRWFAANPYAAAGDGPRAQTLDFLRGVAAQTSTKMGTR